MRGSEGFAVAQGTVPCRTARKISSENSYPQFFNRVRIVVGRPGWSVGVSLRGSASVRLPYDLG